MALEDVVLWTAFGTGVLGAVGFFWQVYNYYNERKESGYRALNAKVLKPWAEVRITHRWARGQANVIALAVPKEALPPDVAPGQEGVEIHALPGASRGTDFLRKNYPKVHASWQDIERLWQRYDELRAHRRSLIEPWIRGQLKKELPKLGPARLSESEEDTYVLDNILAVTEDAGWEIADRGEAARPVRFQTTPTHSGNTIYYEVRGQQVGTLLHTYKEALADSDAMERVVKSCLRRPEVVQVNKDLVATLRDLGKAEEAFRTDMREVTVEVEVEGG